MPSVALSGRFTAMETTNGEPPDKGLRLYSDPHAIRPETGRRVELIRCTDEHTHLEPGLRGTVQVVDSLGTLHVRWDDGSTLGLIPGVDAWKEIDE